MKEFASARLVLLVLLALLATHVGAEESNKPNEPRSSTKGEDTPSEIAKQLHNPLSNLREIIFQLDVLPDVGPDNKTDWATTIQPVWPFALGDGWKLVTYSIIPVVSQPGLDPGSSRKNGLGDSTFFGYLVPPNEGQLIWGFGPALQAPTHTNDDLGVDKWAAGPALIVKDYRREEFVHRSNLNKLVPLRIGAVNIPYFTSLIKKSLPNAEIVLLDSPREFFREKGDRFDAFLFTAEGGSAWTLLYPEYTAVIPAPGFMKMPLAYAIARGDPDFRDLLNGWLILKEKDNTIEKAYNYWVLGQGTGDPRPRWSIVRDVLRWVD